jgi:hypothetical protein
MEVAKTLLKGSDMANVIAVTRRSAQFDSCATTHMHLCASGDDSLVAYI